jgi:cytosine/adenosine deaminase-related metal-dependent hydrolase
MEFLVKGVQLPAATALHGATGLAAEALGMGDAVGMLKPGTLADLVIVDGDPLTGITAMQRIHTVIKEGQVLVSEEDALALVLAVWKRARGICLVPAGVSPTKEGYAHAPCTDSWHQLVLRNHG